MLVRVLDGAAAASVLDLLVAKVVVGMPANHRSELVSLARIVVVVDVLFIAHLSDVAADLHLPCDRKIGTAERSGVGVTFLDDGLDARVPRLLLRIL